MVSVLVTNTGTTAADVPVMVTYAVQTRLVIRYMRMLCAFTKVHLAAGAHATVQIPVRVSDLARYDPTQSWTDLNNAPVEVCGFACASTNTHTGSWMWCDTICLHSGGDSGFVYV